ncbi:MAG TPA: glycoside hydrolase family 88 protein [Bacteroidales bacterium]|nr:glycoside hydrolase family 88 protein [Bacteroidales bacterium]
MRSTSSFLIACLVLLTPVISCQTGKVKNEKKLASEPWSVRMAESEMVRNPSLWMVDFVTEKKWNYTQGLEGLAFIRLSEVTGNEKYFEYAKGFADSLIDENGKIYKYDKTNYNIDQVNPGKMLFLLYDRTKDPRYETAIETLKEQLDSQPRTPEGGFWHKKIYPDQMWLDGLYMGAPFYAEYAARHNQPEIFEDVINQFRLVAKHTYDPATGLYRHAWDASGEMPWADTLTGQAPHAWGRAMGWFSMAIVDVLDFIPENQPGRDELITILQGMFEELVKIQDSQTGGWYQVLDRSGDQGNYIETSCTSMFTYSLLKGVRMGYLDTKFLINATKAYEGLINNFIVTGSDGLVSLTSICGVAGLGGNPYRDGTFEYYINEEIRVNDPKGVAPFIMASIEFESLSE